MNTGFGIEYADNHIDINTVAETPRAAIVNWLMLRAGIRITNDYTHQMILDLWGVHSEGRRVAKVALVVNEYVNLKDVLFNATAEGELQP